MTTTAYDTDHVREVAKTILSQIDRGVLMSLGASSLGRMTVEGLPCLMFIARILPFNKNGARRSRAVKMAVHIALDPSDTYTVFVHHLTKGERVEHARIEGVYADDLNHVLLALDFDGPTALNPRLWSV